MAYQVDTNILLRLVQPNHPMHADAQRAVRALLAGAETIYYLPQNVREFWNVCTRPIERNGLGFSQMQVESEVQRIEGLFTLLDDGPSVYYEWRQLVYHHSVSGVQVHDCYIVAAMIVHGIDKLLTFNKTDFKRYRIDSVDPTTI